MPVQHRIPSYITALAMACLAAAGALPAQEARADLTGPFLHIGGIAGSVTLDTGPSATETGNGWTAGAGIGITHRVAAVGNYVIYRVSSADTRPYDVEQLELGARLRFGGVHSRSVFTIEAGAGYRRVSIREASAATIDVLPDGSEFEGPSAWFGPGVQWFWERRLAAELAVAWAWGNFTRARVDGARQSVDDPFSATTLRLRGGITATLF